MSRAELRRDVGVSDPSLIWALGDIPHVTEEQEATVRGQITARFPSDSPEDATARTELEAMLFGPPSYKADTSPSALAPVPRRERAAA
ncbi:hypothetical protein MRBLMI12_000432 [Microbacterium sp. LMI12-1-1.1]|uniref:hypothetical protein n=1 Tax=Microbacterium sp. LMI12-1-1.1 TaxID=3135225 RepID=UPI0034307A88